MGSGQHASGYGSRRRWISAAALATLSLSVGACTTVRSTLLPVATDGGQGLTYFLPMKQMKVTLTRTPVKLKDMQKALAAAQTAAADAKKAAGEAKDAREKAERELAKLPADASDKLKLDYKDQIDTAKAKEADTSAASDKADLDVKTLQAGVDAVTISGAECTFDAKVELLPAQPDPKERYVARLVHNPMRDDTLTLKVGANGLLASGNIVAADRTGDILVEVAGAIAGLGGGFPSRAAPDEVAPPKAKSCAELPKTFISVFDPNKGSPSEVNAALEKSQYPFRVQVTGDRHPEGAVPPPGKRVPGPQDGQGSDYGGLADGRIYYRSPAPMLVALEQTTKVGCAAGGEAGVCNWQPVDTAVVLVPQAGPISFIPMNSAIFVKTVNDVQFVDGGIASWTADRPSEMLEFVRLPVKIATAIVSVPAQLLSLRVDYSTKDKAMVDAQKAQIAAAQNLRMLKACLETAADDTQARLCLKEP